MELERIVSTVESYPNHVNDLCKGTFKFERVDEGYFERYKGRHMYQVRGRVHWDMVLFDLLRLLRKVFHELFNETEKLNIHQDDFVQICDRFLLHKCTW